MDAIKVDMVTKAQMEREGQDGAVFEQGEMSVDAIPDLDVLTGHVFDILAYLEQPKVKDLLRTNSSVIRMHLNNKYADSVPLGIITILMEEQDKEENIERLLGMFESLSNAKKGLVSLEDAEKELTDDVNEKYLYSKYGSKEAFEAALAKEVQNERRKKETGDITKMSIN